MAGQRIRVKICGITRPEDALAAAEAGADAVGLVFHPASPRYVTMDQATRIAAVVPPFVTVVALLVNATEDLVHAVLRDVRPGLLQFHGDEDEAACARYGMPFIKAIRMAPGLDPAAEAARFPSARGLLTDAWSPDAYGGTGERFDWSRLPASLGKPLVLAGGLTPDNVARAAAQVRPWAVDVSGGVEAAPGIKDAGRIRTFIDNLNRGA